MNKSVYSPPNQPEEISIRLHIENKLKSLDIDNKLKSRDRLTQGNNPLTFRICKVPECIRSSDPDAYKPQVVSIGPYHHGDQGLEAMEKCKWRFLAHIMNGRPHILAECVRKMEEMEEAARQCYADELTMNIDREHLITETTVVERDNSAKKIEREDMAMRKLTMKNLAVKTERGDLITLKIDRGELLMNTNKFVEMLLLDGCFLIGLLVKKSLRNDDVFKNQWAWKRVALDVLLLENQLPFVVLESLFTILNPQMSGSDNLKSTSRIFFQKKLFKNLRLQEKFETAQHLLHFIHMSLPSVPCSLSDNQNNQTKPFFLVRWICHPLTNFMSTWRHDKKMTEPLLVAQSPSREEPSSSFPCQDPSSGNQNNQTKRFCLVRWICHPLTNFMSTWRHDKKKTEPSSSSSSEEPSSGTSHESQQIDENKGKLKIPSVTKLSGAGVKFESDSNHSFLDVDFDRGKMKMGQLQVDDYTNRIFRNFIAFEQCLPTKAQNPANPPNCVFSNYCCFIDSLVNTARDIEILEDCCIIHNLLGSNEDLAAMFNKLGDGVTFKVKENPYLETSKQVNKYIDDCWHKWRAKLVADYFSNPWAAISLGAAILVFIIGIVQFVFSILSFFKG